MFPSLNVSLTQLCNPFLGTGKTESVKDLARALGVQCYVFNCSDQMDYKAMGQIYKGLAQTGAWGCFDEFNRIPVSVLSVCRCREGGEAGGSRRQEVCWYRYGGAGGRIPTNRIPTASPLLFPLRSTQYKTVLDAIRARKEKFLFDEVEVVLKQTVMAFITMNPGYPGRAELPESLKVRGCRGRGCLLLLDLGLRFMDAALFLLGSEAVPPGQLELLQVLTILLGPSFPPSPSPPATGSVPPRLHGGA